MIHHFPSSIFVIWLHHSNEERERERPHLVFLFLQKREGFPLPLFLFPKKLLVSIIPENENPGRIKGRGEKMKRCNRNLPLHRKENYEFPFKEIQAPINRLLLSKKCLQNRFYEDIHHILRKYESTH